MDMEKINRQCQCESTRHFCETSGLQCVTWGGVNYLNDSLNINNTFFRRGIRAG